MRGNRRGGATRRAAPATRCGDACAASDLGRSRLLSAALGCSRLLSATLGRSRLLSAALGYSRPLSATPDLARSRLLSPPGGDAEAGLGARRQRERHHPRHDGGLVRHPRLSHPRRASGRGTAERQPRGIAERWPRDSRETAERQPREIAERDGRERWPRDARGRAGSTPKERISRCHCTTRRKKIGEGAGSTPLVVALDGSALMLDPAAAAARLTSLDEHARLGRVESTAPREGRLPEITPEGVVRDRLVALRRPACEWPSSSLLECVRVA